LSNALGTSQPDSSTVSATPATTPTPVTTIPAAANDLKQWIVHQPIVAAGIALAVVVALLGIRYVNYRLSHSITDDAFVESHLVNIAPQLVSGHLIRYLVEE
jgi:membrane fusion protein (multidrug efflux system)